MATSSDDPVPYIWSIPPINGSEELAHDERTLLLKNSQSESTANDSSLHYVERLHVKGELHKRVSAMAKSFKHVQKPSMILINLNDCVLLPFSNLEGVLFRTVSELCPLPALPNGYQIHICIPTKNHRTFHPLMGNKVINELPIQRIQRKAGIKRKNSVLLPQSNNLYQYFKRPRVT